MTNRPAPNPYRRTAAWIFAVFIVLMLIPMLAGNWSGWAYMIIGGGMGAIIGMAWERGKRG